MTRQMKNNLFKEKTQTPTITHNNTKYKTNDRNATDDARNQRQTKKTQRYMDRPNDATCIIHEQCIGRNVTMAQDHRQLAKHWTITYEIRNPNDTKSCSKKNQRTSGNKGGRGNGAGHAAFPWKTPRKHEQPAWKWHGNVQHRVALAMGSDRG